MLKTVKTAAIVATLLLTAAVSMPTVANAMDPCDYLQDCMSPNERREQHERYMERQADEYERDRRNYCDRGYGCRESGVYNY